MGVSALFPWVCCYSALGLYTCSAFWAETAIWGFGCGLGLCAPIWVNPVPIPACLACPPGPLGSKPLLLWALSPFFGWLDAWVLACEGQTWQVKAYEG